MTRPWIVALTLATSVAAGTWVSGQARVRPAPPLRRPGIPTCAADTPAQLESRTDAFYAVGEIVTASHMYRRSHKAYPSWKDFAQEPPPRVPGSGPMLDWGAREPLAGWRIHYVADPDAFVFTLSGVRDTCGVTFVADDTGLVLDGRSIDGPLGHVVPLATH